MLTQLYCRSACFGIGDTPVPVIYIPHSYSPCPRPTDFSDRCHGPEDLELIFHASPELNPKLQSSVMVEVCMSLGKNCHNVMVRVKAIVNLCVKS